jgi:hypothetical protein
MQNDIIPPNLRRPTNSPQKKPMPTLRLMGHSADEAKKRLVPEAKTIALDSDPAKRRKPHQWVIHHLSKRSKSRANRFGSCNRARNWNINPAYNAFCAKAGATACGLKSGSQTSSSAKTNNRCLTLNGVQVAPNLAQRPVTGIMIENSPDARPQSGLQDAGVVYEAIAEGGLRAFWLSSKTVPPRLYWPRALASALLH